jgi:hypothetical protein
VKTDSEGNECPFCVENEKMDVIAYSASGRTYIAKVKIMTDRGMVALGRAYFVIPVEHHVDYSTLGFDFLKEVTELKNGLKLSFDNEGFNLTKKGGRQKEHLHYWMMNAHQHDQPLGLYTLRERHRELLKLQRAAESRHSPWR